MNLKDFFYDLPEELIAQHPIQNRSDSRMMFLDRLTGALKHRRFCEIASFLSPGDCLVINDSKVMPARLMGFASSSASSSKKIEILLHKRLDEKRWEVLAKPGKKVREGDVVIFGDGSLAARIEEVKDNGLRVAAFEYEGVFEALLDKFGEMPLPHYIKTNLDESVARQRYQTIYAAHLGSVAAPTAGLHFTDEIMREITGMGVQVARVTLHVGLGTFRPVKTENIAEHHMHSEYCRIEKDQADIINNAKMRGKRVIAVGTTSCRTLESRACSNGMVSPGSDRKSVV